MASANNKVQYDKAAALAALEKDVAQAKADIAKIKEVCSKLKDRSEIITELLQRGIDVLTGGTISPLTSLAKLFVDNVVEGKLHEAIADGEKQLEELEKQQREAIEAGKWEDVHEKYRIMSVESIEQQLSKADEAQKDLETKEAKLAATQQSLLDAKEAERQAKNEEERKQAQEKVAQLAAQEALEKQQRDAAVVTAKAEEAEAQKMLDDVNVHLIELQNQRTKLQQDIKLKKSEQQGYVKEAENWQLLIKETEGQIERIKGYIAEQVKRLNEEKAERFRKQLRSHQDMLTTYKTSHSKLQNQASACGIAVSNMNTELSNLSNRREDLSNVKARAEKVIEKAQNRAHN